MFYFYLPIIDNCLYKKTDDILKSMKRRGFISFDYIKVIKCGNKKFRDATENEMKEIEEVTNSVCEKYNITKKGLNLSMNKEKIYKNIEEILGYKPIKKLKLKQDNYLIENIKLLEHKFNLDDSCWKQVNKHMTTELERNLYNEAVNKKEEYKKKNIKKSLKSFIDEFYEKGAPISYKFEKNFDVGEEENIRRDIEAMINKLIRIEEYWYS